MNIAILGAGRIGTTFGYQLAKAGHAVTLIARNQRLAELQKEGAIVTVKDERVPVSAAAELDAQTPWDLVIVTVMDHQVEAVLPQLTKSRAKRILFAFNRFETVQPLRAAVGAERFVAGFPQMTAFFVDGKLKSVANGPGMVVTTDSAEVNAILKGAGMPVALEPDMESYLRSHISWVLPMMLAGHLSFTKKARISWGEAQQLTRAKNEALALTKHLGNKVTPGLVVMLWKIPDFLFTLILWSMSNGLRDLGAFGPAEPRNMIDAMIRAAPERTKTLASVRP